MDPEEEVSGMLTDIWIVGTRRERRVGYQGSPSSPHSLAELAARALAPFMRPEYIPWLRAIGEEDRTRKWMTATEQAQVYGSAKMWNLPDQRHLMKHVELERRGGRKHGVSREWNKAGVLVAKTDYVWGVRHGEHLSRSVERGLTCRGLWHRGQTVGIWRRENKKTSAHFRWYYTLDCPFPCLGFAPVHEAVIDTHCPSAAELEAVDDLAFSATSFPIMEVGYAASGAVLWLHNLGVTGEDLSSLPHLRQGEVLGKAVKFYQRTDEGQGPVREVSHFACGARHGGRTVFSPTGEVLSQSFYSHDTLIVRGEDSKYRTGEHSSKRVGTWYTSRDAGERLDDRDLPRAECLATPDPAAELREALALPRSSPASPKTMAARVGRWRGWGVTIRSRGKKRKHGES